MITAYYCVFIAAFLPYIFTVLAKWSANFNNRRPREYLDKIEGWRKRAHWVQVNSFEAFPAFAAAVIIACLQAPHSITTINLLAEIFIIARLAYGICYIADWASFRSLVWFVGLSCVLGLFLIATSN